MSNLKPLGLILQQK